MNNEHDLESLSSNDHNTLIEKEIDESVLDDSQISMNREMSLGIVSLKNVFHEEKIDSRAIQELAQGNVDRVFEILEQNGRFTPMVASEILRHSEPSSHNSYPTATQIKEEMIEARVIARPLKAISGKWANRFDRFLEEKAKKQVVRIGSEAGGLLDVIGGIENPKKEFVDEIHGMYYDSKNRDPRWVMARILDGITRPNSDFKEKFPLVYHITMTRKLKDILSGRDDVVEIFAPDIVKGIEGFLRKQGIEIKSLTAYDESPMRWMADIVASDRVRDIPNMIEKVLTDSHAALPENGKRFKENILAMCREIVTKSEQGEDGHALTGNLIKELKQVFASSGDNPGPAR